MGQGWKLWKFFEGFEYILSSKYQKIMSGEKKRRGGALVAFFAFGMLLTTISIFQESNSSWPFIESSSAKVVEIPIYDEATTDMESIYSLTFRSDKPIILRLRPSERVLNQKNGIYQLANEIEQHSESSTENVTLYKNGLDDDGVPIRVSKTDALRLVASNANVRAQDIELPQTIREMMMKPHALFDSIPGGGAQWYPRKLLASFDLMYVGGEGVVAGWK